MLCQFKRFLSQTFLASDYFMFNVPEQTPLASLLALLLESQRENGFETRIFGQP